MKFRILAVAALAAFAMGCSSDSEKDQFVKGCVNGGADKAVCSCMYDNLTKKHSVKEMEKMIERGDQAFAMSMIEAAMSCAK